MVLTLANGSPLPPIGIGTSTGIPIEEELSRTLGTAFETGYRHIDTAHAYQNEKIIGKILQKWFQSGKLKREDIFVTTKLPTGHLYPEVVETSIKSSLSNLQLSYIDLYLIHFPMTCKYHEGTFRPVRDDNGYAVTEGRTDHGTIWKKMELLVDSGLTRYIGLSNYNISQIETVLRTARIKPACLQIEVHPYLQQRHLVDFCHRSGIAVVGFQPLGAPGYQKRVKDFFLVADERQIPNVLDDPQISRISKKHSKSVAQIVLRFSIQSGIIPIPKSINPERIKENFQIFDFVLDEDDVATLRSLEIGERARITTFSNILKGIEEHPDYPFGKL